MPDSSTSPQGPLWIVNPYGDLPGESWREHYSLLLGRALATAGHEVVWWVANFSHRLKVHRSSGWVDLAVSPGFTVTLVPTTGYKRNVGLGRLWFECVYAIRFFRRALQSPRPSCIIVLDTPTLYSYLSMVLSTRLRAGLVLSVQDLWPELFVAAFPKRVRKVASQLLFPLYRLRRHIRNHASSIFSLAESYLRRAVADVSGACAALHTAVIFNGIDVQRLRDVGTTGPLVCEAKHLGEKAAGELWAVFSGSLGKTYDIRTMAAAAELLASWNRKIRIIITGAGPLAEFLRGAQQALGERRLLYLGTIGNEDLYRLYMRCDIGLCAYGAESNVAMPDKAYDYLAAGLVVVNSLKGELEGRVCDRELGIAYRAGDAASLAKALCYLADNPEMRVRMRENSYAAALEFDQARQFPKIVSLVEKVTSPKSPVTGEGVAPGPASGPNPAKAIGRVGGTPQL